MQMFTNYADDRVRFKYPTSYRLKATPSSGQYYLRQSKNSVLSISVFERAVLVSAFDSMALGLSPGMDRRKVVHDNFALGSKTGRAIAWEIFNASGLLFENSIVFMFESGEFGMLAELYFRPPNSSDALETIVASLEIVSR